MFTSKEQHIHLMIMLKLNSEQKFFDPKVRKTTLTLNLKQKAYVTANLSSTGKTFSRFHLAEA